MDKDKRISAELKKLKKILDNIPEDKRDIATRLIENLAFMAITLEDLKETVNEEGSVIYSTNGNGFTTMTEHPAQRAYNTMLKSYNTTIKQLNDILPDSRTETAAKAGEALKEFITKGKPGK